MVPPRRGTVDGARPHLDYFARPHPGQQRQPDHRGHLTCNVRQDGLHMGERDGADRRGFRGGGTPGKDPYYRDHLERVRSKLARFDDPPPVITS